MGWSVGSITNVIDTQIGRLGIKQSIVKGCNVEDFMKSKVVSQGVLGQFFNKAQETNLSQSTDKIPYTAGFEFK